MTELGKQLQKRNLHCYVDKEEPSGTHLAGIYGFVKKSKMLVLIVTDDVTDSPWIGEELKHFAETHADFKNSNRARIFPINVDGAIGSPPISEKIRHEAPWNLLDQIRWEDETADALKSGLPSDAIAQRIDQAFKFTRREVRQARLASGILTVLCLLATVAVISNFSRLSLGKEVGKLRLEKTVVAQAKVPPRKYCLALR